MSKFTIKALNNKIVLLKAKNQRDLAKAMVRFQEHYESPFPEIRGKTFTLGYMASLYSMDTKRSGGTGGFTYYQNDSFAGDWNGFNVPSSSIEPFVKGLFDPLTNEEADIVEILKYRTDNYYLIGIHGDQPEIKHEVAHALYNTSDPYRFFVDEAINELEVNNPELIKKLWGFLSNWGYTHNVYKDELHAYFGVDYWWMASKKKEELAKENIDVDCEALKTLSDKLIKFFDQYAPDLSDI